MKSHALCRSIPVAVISAAAALHSGVLGSAHAASTGKSLTFKGPTEDTRHGPVQVSIVVRSKKIVNVKATITPNEDGRSPFLQSHAVPVLKQEVLTAQSAKIDQVSGATEFSDAYIQSLESAIKKAHSAKALK
ncbi:MAG TPA: FMN-binding protein [Chloroflexota bacterium]